MIPVDGRIDVHHHVATQHNPLYQVPDPRIWWSEKEALEMMDRNNISVAMLSYGGRLPQNPHMIKTMMAVRDSPLGRTKPLRAAMRRSAHRANLVAADIASKHRDRFGFFATMMLLNPDDAIGEASFAFDELGADGLFMPTNVGTVYLGEPVHDPLFAELDRRGSVVFVHPMHLPCPLIPAIPAHVCDFLLSTVRAATNLVPQRSSTAFPPNSVHSHSRRWIHPLCGAADVHDAVAGDGRTQCRQLGGRLPLVLLLYGRCYRARPCERMTG